MKKSFNLKKWSAYMLIGVLLLFSLSGCSSSEPPTEAVEQNGSEKGGEVEAVGINAIGIGTGSVGSSFYTVGGGFAKVWEKLGVQAAVEVTGGSLQNCTLVHTGQLQSALISQGAAYQAWNAEGLFKGKEEHKNLRAALPIQPSYIHGWTLDKSINSYRDLEGKVVSGGPAGGTSEEYNKAIMEALSIKPSRYINAGFADTTGQLTDGLLDAVFCSMGVPTAAAAEAAATHGAKIIGVHKDDFETAKKVLPFLVDDEIPANTYTGQTDPVPTLADINVYFFNKDVPEDVVYEFVKQAYASSEMLINTFAGLKAMKPENVANIRVTLHPGAYKYYKEIGIDVPSEIIPE